MRRMLWSAFITVVSGFILIPALSAQLRVITTVAGREFTYPSPVPALDAPMGAPRGIALDRAGNVYFSSQNFNMILRISAQGIITVAAGNGFRGFSGEGDLGVNASLNDPLGILVDREGNLYIADKGNHRVRRMDTDGVLTTIAGNGAPGFSGDGGPARLASLRSPSGLALDSAGNLYISDTDNHRIRRVSSNGTITTIAGTGQGTYSGDGGAAVSASLYLPEGLAIDGAGNLYIADLGNNRIRRINTQGVIGTYAGNGNRTVSGDGGSATAAGIALPRDIAFDREGNLLVSDQDSFRIRRISPQGVIGRFAGSGVSGLSADGVLASGADMNPYGLAVDPAGSVYIAEYGNNKVRRITSNGLITTVAGTDFDTHSPDGVAAPSAILDFMGNLSLDRQGNLYMAGGNRIRRLGTDGSFVTVVGTGKSGYAGDGGPANQAMLAAPFASAFDSRGNMIVVDTYNHRVRRITPNGIISTIAGTGRGVYGGDGGPATSASLFLPTGVAVDQEDNIYVADLNLRIRRIDRNGIITTFAGNGSNSYSGDGGLATLASIGQPYGVAFDGQGNLYIADNFNHVVRRVTPQGVISTYAGNGVGGYSGDGGAARNARLNSPFGLFFDSLGNLFIGDFGNHRVRMVNPAGIITTVAGNGTRGFSGDGGLALMAQLNNPFGVAVNASGVLYISENANWRIRAVLSTPPTIQVEPTELTFAAGSGELPAASQTLSIRGSAQGMAYTASVDSQSSSWLRIDSATGNAPSRLQISVDARDLKPGDYTGAITINSTVASPPVQTARVSLQVRQGKEPTLGLSTERLSFALNEGGGESTQYFAVRNTGGGTLPFRLEIETASGGDWLRVGPENGEVPAGTAQPVKVGANPGTLAPGTYRAAVIARSGQQREVMPVVMTITASRNTILTTQSSLTFETVAGGGRPAPQSFAVLNVGSGTMSWSAEARTLSGGQGWLRLSSRSGRVDRPFVDLSNVEVAIDQSGLAPGEYYGQIDIRAAADNSPQIVSVILNVAREGTNLGPEVRPSALVFTGITGENPGSQTITIANLGRTAANFESSRIGGWFLQAPEAAQVEPNRPARIIVQPDFTNLTPGVRRGAITLLFQDGTIRTVSLLSVAASPETARDIERGAASCSNTTLQVSITSLQAGFRANVGQASTVSARIVDSCGTPLAPEPGRATVDVWASFSNGDPQITLTHIGAGQWTGSWRPVRAEPSVTVTVTGLYAVGLLQQLGRQAITGSALDIRTTPLVTEGGIKHAATIRTTLVAPGSLLAVQGRNLSEKEVVVEGVPYPSELAGTEVLLGDRPLPLLYTSDGQVNVQVPYNLPVNTQHQLIARRGTAISVPERLSVAAAQPGIFTVDSSGAGQGVITHADRVTIAGPESIAAEFQRPSSPVRRGQGIVVFATGLGQVSPAVAPGLPAPAEPLARVVNPLQLTIGGVPALVSFAGLSPGLSGVYHVEAVVPENAPAGDQVPVILEVAGQASPAVTMAIR